MDGRMRFGLAAAGLLVIALSAMPAAVRAADQTMGTTGVTASTGDVAVLPEVAHGSKIIGKDIHDGNGKKFGQVQDLVLDTQGNRVLYAVVEAGGVMGMGDRLFAIPWNLIQMQPTDAKDKHFKLVANVDKDQIIHSRSFTKKDWPDMSTADWIQSMRAAYGATAMDTLSDQGLSHGAMRHGSDVIGWRVQNDQGAIGKIDDLIFSVPDRHLTYAGVKLDRRDRSVKGDYALLPWTSLQLHPTEKFAFVPASLETIQSVAFDRKHYPDLTNRDYATMLYNRFQVAPYWQTYGYAGDETTKAAAADAGDKDKGKHGEGMHRMDINAPVDMKAVKSYTGTVDTLHAPEAGKAGHDLERLTLMTDNNEKVYVMVGPHSYLEGQKLMLAKGDKVTVMGVPHTVKDKTMVTATSIQKGDVKVQLRDDSGKPVWTVAAPTMK